MAAPQVSGALALIKSQFPWENYTGIRDRALMAVDRPINDDPHSPGYGRPKLEGTSRTEGRLNLNKALQTRSMLRNLSTRAYSGDGERVMIGGFVVGGSPSAGAMKVLIRGLGPSVGVSVARLGNPRIELYDANNLQIDANNNWWEHESAAEIDALNLEPGGNEAAMIKWLNPGRYTVHLRDEGTEYGVGLFEIYEMHGNTNEESRLRNLSTRCFVGVGEEAPIAGMIIGDTNNPNAPDRRVLMFAKGPSLPGVGERLWDPEIQVLSTGEFNNNWEESLGYRIAEELREALVAPAHPLEGGLWPTFRPGTHHVIMRGWAQSTGIGLIEFFEY
jgi:hypothetical protein